MGIFDILKKKKNTETQENISLINNEAPNVDIIGKYYNLSDLTKIDYASGHITLSPFDAGYIIDETNVKMFQVLGNTEGVKKFLPFLDMSTPASFRECFLKILMTTEVGYRFIYMIKLDNIPVGLIFCNTPDFNKKTINYNYWTIDFMTFEVFENRGIMFSALIQMLAFLKNVLHVDDVRFMVSSDNEKCLRLMQKISAEELDNTNFSNIQGGLLPRIFRMDLSHIRFVQQKHN